MIHSQDAWFSSFTAEETLEITERVYGINCTSIGSEARNELLRGDPGWGVFGLESCEDKFCAVADPRARSVSVFDGGRVGIVDEEVDDIGMLLGHRAVGSCARSAGPVVDVNGKNASPSYRRAIAG